MSTKWTEAHAANLAELTGLLTATKKAVEFLTAAQKAEMSPEALSHSIQKKHEYEDRKIVSTKEWAATLNGKVKAHKPHADGIVYAWDILIQLDYRYKLLIEIDRVEEIEYWQDPLMFQARVFQGPQRKDDRFGRFLTQNQELRTKNDLNRVLKEAREHAAPKVPRVVKGRK